MNNVLSMEEEMLNKYKFELIQKQNEMCGQEKVLINISKRFRRDEVWEIEREIRMTIKDTAKEIKRLERKIAKAENELYKSENEMVDRNYNIADEKIQEEDTHKKINSNKNKKENVSIFIITGLVLLVMSIFILVFVKNFIL